MQDQAGSQTERHLSHRPLAVGASRWHCMRGQNRWPIEVGSEVFAIPQQGGGDTARFDCPINENAKEKERGGLSVQLSNLSNHTAGDDENRGALKTQD